MRILLTAATALPLIATSFGLAVLPATPSYALPQNATCLITTYYKTSALEEEVGQRTQCTGSPATMTGRTSPWHTSERIVVDNHGPGGGGSGGGRIHLPCEFLAAGCSNLPANRFGNG
jgi:hypothetical protein